MNQFPLALTADIVTMSPHAMFGLTTSPAYIVHDRFDEVFDQQAVNKTDVYIDKNARVLTAAPRTRVRDFCLNDPTTATFTAVTGGASITDTVLDPQTGKRIVLFDDATKDAQFKIAAATAWSLDFGWCFKFVRGVAAADATHDRDHIYLDLVMDSVDSSVKDPVHTSGISFRLRVRHGEPFILEVSRDHGTTWQEMTRSKEVPDTEKYLETHDRTLNIVFLPYRSKNVLSIYINHDIDMSVSLPDDAVLPDVMFKVSGMNGKTLTAFYEIVYPTSWSVESASKDIGFVPTTEPSERTIPDIVSNPMAFPIQCTVNIVCYPDPVLLNNWKWKLTGTNAPYSGSGEGLTFSYYTPVIDAAEIEWPPQEYHSYTDTPVNLNPRRVTESHTFDMNTLTITRSASITCDNHHAIWSPDLDGKRVSGVRAVSIARGWNGDNQIGLVGWLGETNRYSRSDPHQEVTFNVFDRSFPVNRRVCSVLPPLDGWCINAAIRFLAGKGSITQSAMASIPNCATGPNPSGCNHYKLPVGSGVSPRMKPNPTSPLWQEMRRIASMYKYILGFSETGDLLFYPYDIDQFDTVDTIFSIYPGRNADGSPMLNEFTGSFETVCSVSDVKSRVTLIGIDPVTWQPLYVNNASKENSIVFNQADPAFLGFYDEWVDIDPVYTNLVFMQDFANRMSQQTSIPALNVEFQLYLNPYLKLLDKIMVYEPLTLGSNIREMFITSLVHQYTTGGGKTRGVTHFQARSTLNY